MDRIQFKTWYVAWVQTDNPALLFRIDKSSLGVSRVGVATPWDDCQYANSNANTFVRACAYRVFLTSCFGINLGDIPLGLRHPRMSPWLIPPHSVRKPYTNSPPSSIVTLQQLETQRRTTALSVKTKYLEP